MRSFFFLLLAARHAAGCVCGPGNLTWSDTRPNLLVVGDSISAVGTGYVEDLTSVLGGLAHVVHAGTVADNGRRLGIEPDLGHKGPCGTSFGVLECVDTWLGPSHVGRPKRYIFVGRIAKGVAPSAPWRHDLHLSRLAVRSLR